MHSFQWLDSLSGLLEGEKIKMTNKEERKKQVLAGVSSLSLATIWVYYVHNIFAKLVMARIDGVASDVSGVELFIVAVLLAAIFIVPMLILRKK